MSVLTKKQPINNKVKVVLYGPANRKDELISEAQKLNFEQKNDSVPALECLSEYVDLKQLPAISLRTHRENAEMTQKELAEKLGVKQHHISEMENSKRPIGKKLAQKIADIFGTSYRSYI